jgi:hypothetical protein
VRANSGLDAVLGIVGSGEWGVARVRGEG